MTDKKATTEDKSPSLIQVMMSVLSAGFGVQSSKNRERDFKYGNAQTFVTIGLIATLVFVLTIYGIVTLVIG